jgi:hypothetical protein
MKLLGRLIEWLRQPVPDDGARIPTAGRTTRAGAGPRPAGVVGEPDGAALQADKRASYSFETPRKEFSKLFQGGGDEVAIYSGAGKLFCIALWITY